MVNPKLNRFLQIICLYLQSILLFKKLKYFKFYFWKIKKISISCQISILLRVEKAKKRVLGRFFDNIDNIDNIWSVAKYQYS